MEGLSSSTTKIRNKRGDWLSRSKKSVIIKCLIVLAACALIATVLAFTIPYIRNSLYNAGSEAPNSAKSASAFRNTIKNGTSVQVSLDDMLKSFGYNTGLEKDGLQLCNLNPESRGELGKGTWTLLHIMASTYPVNPTPEVIQDHTIFFQLLPRIYPCPECRAHMRQMFHELPPQLNNQLEFKNWVCEAHNLVNIRLNKPVFDCSKLDDRWDCGCNIVPGQAIGGVEPELANLPSKKDRESRNVIKKEPRMKKEIDSRANKREIDSRADSRISKKDRKNRHTTPDQARKYKSNSHVNNIMSLNPSKKN